MTSAQATRIRGGVDLALVLSMLARASEPEDDDDDEPDEVGKRAAAELGALTVGEAAARVLAFMESEGKKQAQDPRQLHLFDNR